MRYQILFVLLIHLGWCVLPAAASSPPTFSPGDLVINEFFTGWNRVDPVTGQVTPLPYPEPPSFGAAENVVVDHSGHAFFASLIGTTLYDLDLTGRQVSELVTFPSGIDGIAVSNSDQIYVATNSAVVSVDRLNHTFQTLKTGAFFEAQAIVFNPIDGNLYVSEFVNDLWRINPITGQSSRVNVPDGAGAFWDDLVVLPNGNLIAVDSARETMSRIIPSTGVTTTFSSQFPPFPMRSMTTDLQGNVIVTAASSIFRYNGTTGAQSVLTPSTTFFSAPGIAMVPVAVTMVPEPTLLGFASITGMFLLNGRRWSIQTKPRSKGCAIECKN
jgi:streptogramin lyase